MPYHAKHKRSLTPRTVAVHGCAHGTLPQASRLDIRSRIPPVFRMSIKPLRPLARRVAGCSSIWFAIAIGVGICASGRAAEQRPLEIEDLFRIKRVSDPKISPDGRWVAYVVTQVNKDENNSNSDLWIVPSEGGEPRQLTSSPKHDRHPRWSPDGKWLAFESNRGGKFQIHLIPIDGGEARELTSLSTEAQQPVWSPDGKRIAFVSAVFPEFSDKPFKESDAANKKKEGARKSKVKGA